MMSDCTVQWPSTLTDCTRQLTCPRCGFKFSILYARATACQSCRLAVRGCSMVRCPRCDKEFSIRKTAPNAPEYVSRLLADYLRDFGERPTS